MADVNMGYMKVYDAFATRDARSMLLKARLVVHLTQIIENQGLSRRRAAELLGFSEARLNNILKGQFRSLSEMRLLDCLTQLGYDAQIVIEPAPRDVAIGKIDLVLP
ncbi:helix-turn-helix domain-containing protein [Amantichitinum ursilacus]|uniref:HigA2-like helix-turn-helix domain-containing protein n=1 Tax=Amantichitinum ursilacus TaxID=857265 RepID=A0A0N1JRH5_9NEIS|nr:XRE family transcriptional regulator [Amantichitinum ursilacus]KPC49169.1 hypothetical protein WG78_21655 [Amantichitinum ursilacus]